MSEWIIYWAWEAGEVWHVGNEDIRLALCLYGLPKEVDKVRINIPGAGEMEWYIWKIQIFDSEE